MVQQFTTYRQNGILKLPNDKTSKFRSGWDPEVSSQEMGACIDRKKINKPNQA